MESAKAFFHESPCQYGKEGCIISVFLTPRRHGEWLGVGLCRILLRAATPCNRVKFIFPNRGQNGYIYHQ